MTGRDTTDVGGERSGSGSERPPEVIDVNDMLLDREIVDATDGIVGKVDELELREDGDAPELSAILCGPLALGPRIGGRLGTWWVSIARRLRDSSAGGPARIPIEDVTELTRRQLKVARTGDDYGTRALATWLDDHLIGRIPGGRRAQR